MPHNVACCSRITPKLAASLLGGFPKDPRAPVARNLRRIYVLAPKLAYEEKGARVCAERGIINSIS